MNQYFKLLDTSLPDLSELTFKSTCDMTKQLI